VENDGFSQYRPTAEDLQRLGNNFDHHSPKGQQGERYTEIRSRCKQLAHFLHFECPPSRERSVALTKLEEVMFWANASIARNE
jgi:hypothetical protein